MAKIYAVCGKCGKKGCDWFNAEPRRDLIRISCKYCEASKPYVDSDLQLMFPGNSHLTILQRQNFAAEHITDDLLRWKPAERIIPPTTLDEVLSQLAAAQTALTSIYHLYEQADRALTTVKKFMDEQKIKECKECQEQENTGNGIS